MLDEVKGEAGEEDRSSCVAKRLSEAFLVSAIPLALSLPELYRGYVCMASLDLE